MVYEARGHKMETLEPKREVEVGKPGAQPSPERSPTVSLPVPKSLPRDTLVLRHPTGGYFQNGASDLPKPWAVGSSTTANCFH